MATKQVNELCLFSLPPPTPPRGRSQHVYKARLALMELVYGWDQATPPYPHTPAPIYL